MPATHLTQLGVLDLISQAGLMAKLVLTLLLLTSIGCWSIMISKWKLLKQATLQNKGFLETFWTGRNLDEIVSKCDTFPRSPTAAVFHSAVKELRKLSSDEQGPLTVDKMDNIQRTLMRASTHEISSLEKNVGFLATTASAAPFVGLFGTVWGIMNSFQNIGATGAANLAVVAPGISEALITTATGIGAAIPAAIAYNYFVGQIKKIAVEMECFSHDFTNIIQRNLTQGQNASTSSKKGL